MQGKKNLLLSQQLAGFPGECMPVAAQCGMPFTQVLALRESCPSSQEVPAGTATCGWGQCFCTVVKRWMGSGFILSVSLTLRKKLQKNQKKTHKKVCFCYYWGFLCTRRWGYSIQQWMLISSKDLLKPRDDIEKNPLKPLKCCKEMSISNKNENLALQGIMWSSCTWEKVWLCLLEFFAPCMTSWKLS